MRVTIFGLVSVVSLGSSPFSYEVPARAQEDDRPNVLLIVTDDQRATGTLVVMDGTREWLKSEGRRYPNAYATTPLCCPSRASIMTGRYTHNHGVHTNAEGDLDQESTIQYYLSQAGYRNAIFGKYLNPWHVTRTPPNFDRWSISNKSKGIFNGGEWNVNGEVRRIEKYSTVYIRRKALEFLRDMDSTDDSRPWFLYVATHAPHAEYIPQKKYSNADVGSVELTEGAYERRLRDKPTYVQDADKTRAEARYVAMQQRRTLLSVDDMVDMIRAELFALGEKRRTLAIFMSDNGFLWGEHGLVGSVLSKNNPYTDSIAIPLLVSWPGHIEPGSVDNRVVANIDIAPTIMDAVGLTPDASRPMDGRSLLDPDWDRPTLYTEYWHSPETPVPHWGSVRTPGYHYIEYYSSDRTTIEFREYYNLEKDPWELRNLFADGDPSNDPENAPQLSAQVEAFSRCAGATCP